MDLNNLVPVLVLFLTGVGMLAIGIEDVSAQSRFDSGDSQDDANTGTQDGSDTDSGNNQDVEDSSTGSDSNSDRFDSGDNQDDTNTDAQDQPDNQLSNTQDDSSRFDSGDSQDDTNVDGEPDNQNQQDTQGQQTSEESAGGGGGGFISVESLDISDEQLSVQVSPNTVSQGQEATISGSVDTDEDVRNLAVSIFLNGQNIDTVRMGEEGTYSTTFSPNESGTIRAEFQGARATNSFNIGGESQLTIRDTTITGGNSPDQDVEVCAQVQSPQDAEVQFYVDGQLQDSTTGTGELCFDATLESGTNEFEVVASIGENTVRDSVVRNTNTPNLPFTQNDQQSPDQGITGDFAANMPNFSNLVGGGLVNNPSNSLLWVVSIISGLALTGLLLL